MTSQYSGGGIRSNPDPEPRMRTSLTTKTLPTFALLVLAACYGDMQPPDGDTLNPWGGAGDDDSHNPTGPGDEDGDGIDNEDEGGEDSDGDGQPNWQDSDSDGDGIPDSVEGTDDSDGDGTPDYLDTDSDGDGIPDAAEGWDDTDGDGIPNFQDTDSDGDGIPDTNDNDLDGDGIDNGDEQSGDSDGDGIPDYADTDSDNDGAPDNEEVENGTDPTDEDTDNDGWTDEQEEELGTDPTDPLDMPEGTTQTIPGWTPSVITVSFETQIQMGDVMFVLDETCSMTGTLDDIAANFQAVASQLNTLIPDITFGVASYDDYGFGAMGDTGDKPFYRWQQQTTDLGSVQGALSSLTADGGYDWPEGTIEALYQAATGFGYDQNCDGNYDAQTDVRPFNTDPFDAFGGGTPGEAVPGTVGTGTEGGNGFRTGAVPILIYSTDAHLRNAFPPYGEGPKGSSPPTGCAMDAAAPMLQAALEEINARAIGVPARSDPALIGGPMYWPDSAMEMVAQWTNSWLDLNGNGVPDGGEWMVYPSSGADIVDQVIAGVQDFTANVTYDMTMEAEDPADAIVTIEPPAYYDVPALNTVTFTLTLEPTPEAATTMFSDTIYNVPVVLYGDGEVVLAEWLLSFVVQAGP
jgi:hypothetical protein